MFQLDIHSSFTIIYSIPALEIQPIVCKNLFLTSLKFQQRAYFCPNLELHIFQNVRILSKYPC